ncbi:MAG: DUF459 domain-containing protein, partial [Hyphomicrobiales bacterium]
MKQKSDHCRSPHKGSGPALFIAVAMLVVALPLTLFWSRSGPQQGAELVVSDALKRAQVVRAQFFWSSPPRRTRRKPIKRTIRKKPVQVVRPKRVAPTGTLEGAAAGDKTATRIVVFGDSLASGLWQGLAGSIGTEKKFQVLKKTKVSSGIVRDDFYDWGKVVDLVLKDQRVDIAVWMLGVNDGQSMRTKKAKLPPRSKEWMEQYRARVDKIIKAFQAKGTAVYWVGLPIMRSQRISGNVAFFNEIVRERVELAGARYVDIWDGFADQSGKYDAYGPDLAGKKRKLRQANGVHLTKRGNKKLAYFVAQAVRRDLEEFGTTLDGRQVIRQGSGRGGLVVGANGRGQRAISSNAILVGGDPASAGGPAPRNASVGATLRTASASGQGRGTAKADG